MEHRPSRVGPIGVGARLEQLGTNVEVSVDHGERKRSRTVPGRRVDVGAQGDKDIYRAVVSLANGEEQCCKLALRTGLDIGTRPNQSLDRLDVVLRSGPHQGRLSTPCLGGVHDRTGHQKLLHDINPAGPRRDHEHGVTTRHDAIDRRAGADQRLHHQRAAIGGR